MEVKLCIVVISNLVISLKCVLVHVKYHINSWLKYMCEIQVVCLKYYTAGTVYMYTVGFTDKCAFLGEIYLVLYHITRSY